MCHLCYSLPLFSSFTCLIYPSCLISSALKCLRHAMQKQTTYSYSCNCLALVHPSFWVQETMHTLCSFHPHMQSWTVKNQTMCMKHIPQYLNEHWNSIYVHFMYIPRYIPKYSDQCNSITAVQKASYSNIPICIQKLLMSYYNSAYEHCLWAITTVRQMVCPLFNFSKTYIKH